VFATYMTIQIPGSLLNSSKGPNPRDDAIFWKRDWRRI
jgi:hypothetical protein